MPDNDSADVLAERVAAADRGEAPPPGQAQPAAAPAVGPDDARREQFRQAAAFFGRAARALLSDRIKAHWTDAALLELGNALGDCAVYYGWDFNPSHPLARLGAAAIPLGWPVVEPVVAPYLKLIAPKPAANEPPPAANAQADNAPQPAASAAAAVSEASSVMDGAPRTTFPPRDQRAAPLENEPVS